MHQISYCYIGMVVEEGKKEGELTGLEMAQGFVGDMFGLSGRRRGR